MEEKTKKLRIVDVTYQDCWCPYCNEKIATGLEDVQYYFERVMGYECPHCNKTFKVE